MGRIFGTDGVRGVANRDLTAELAVDLAVAAAHILGEVGAFADRRPTAVVARDPRASGEFLEAAVVAGLASAGVDVHRLGIVPTPGAAYLTSFLEADMGVMISASHNAMPDNGIKFFSRGGLKLDDDLEIQIEKRLREPWDRPIGAGVGRIGDSHAGLGTYIKHLVESAPGRLDGLKIVLDCANGAAYETGPSVFEQLGATVIAIHAEPDGLNINHNCGSTHIEDLQEAVVRHGADAGFALDGDADRCLAVDATGQVVDGDQILAILAIAARDAGRLPDDTVVATVMSNLGFVQALAATEITVIQTSVGDRYVLEAMRSGGYNLGGEQSGHFIMSDFATTGDGVLAAVHVAARMLATGESLASLAAVMKRLPQVLINVPDVDKARADTDPVLRGEVAIAAAKLGNTGRVLLRQSGTEPLVRVMVEATTHEEAASVAEHLAEVVRVNLAL